MIEANLVNAPLAGFVAEGTNPYADMSPGIEAALRRAQGLGMPVVGVGRGSPAGPGPAPSHRPFLRGNDLSATKARLLLTACLLRFGALAVAADPDQPSAEERIALDDALRRYQEVFDSH